MYTALPIVSTCHHVCCHGKFNRVAQQIYAETVTPYLGSKPGLANHGYAIHIQTCLEHNPRE